MHKPLPYREAAVSHTALLRLHYLLRTQYSSAAPVPARTGGSVLQVSAVLPGIMMMHANANSNTAPAMVQLLKTATAYSDLGVQNVCGPSAPSKSSGAAGSSSSKPLLRWRLTHASYAASISYSGLPVRTAPLCMSVQRSGVAWNLNGLLALWSQLATYNRAESRLEARLAAYGPGLPDPFHPGLTISACLCMYS